MPAAGTCILFVTCPDAKVAEAIARDLVEARLAACGNVTAPVTSVYRWKGEVHREEEVFLLVKTRRDLVPGCVHAIRALHPYEVPEIVALPIVAGSREYLDWIRAESRSPAKRPRRTRTTR
jgi:periplasmic divalent cation tolerance protein